MLSFGNCGGDGGGDGGAGGDGGDSGHVVPINCTASIISYPVPRVWVLIFTLLVMGRPGSSVMTNEPPHGLKQSSSSSGTNRVVRHLLRHGVGRRVRSIVGTYKSRPKQGNFAHYAKEDVKRKKLGNQEVWPNVGFGTPNGDQHSSRWQRSSSLEAAGRVEQSEAAAPNTKA